MSGANEEGVEQSLERAAALIADAPVVSPRVPRQPRRRCARFDAGIAPLVATRRPDQRRVVPESVRRRAHYRELPGLETLVPPADLPREPDVMVTFDCGSIARLGDLEPAARAARELIVLDHHVSNDRYGSVNVIDPAAAATGVVVRRLMEELGLVLAHDAAVCLYAALVCDTGRFQYATTTPQVFDLARELVAYDVPVERLSRTLFEEHRFAYLQLVAEVLGRAELCVDQRFVWTSVTVDDLERHGVTIDEAEGLIDLVRRTAEAEVSCVVKEEPGGTVRVSLRSLGDIDVCRLAEREGGGGHRFAAGFTSSDPIPDVIARIKAAL